MNYILSTCLKVAGGIIGISVASGIIAFVKEQIDDTHKINAKDRMFFNDCLLDKRDPKRLKESKHVPGLYEKYLKRPFDCMLATGALIILSPILAITAILVRTKLGTPVVFTQERPGKDEKIFKLYKFRTMTDDRDKNGELLPDEMRLTNFGKMLRASSCDELLELVNIIKGDMAIVGPRPLLVRYLERYNEYQRRRHEVRPGLTGLAQIHGRNSAAWKEKFDYDVEYVDHISFKGDVKIILDTVGMVLRKDGISSTTSATMEEFMGNEE